MWVTSYFFLQLYPPSFIKKPIVGFFHVAHFSCIRFRPTQPPVIYIMCTVCHCRYDAAKISTGVAPRDSAYAEVAIVPGQFNESGYMDVSPYPSPFPVSA